MIFDGEFISAYVTVDSNSLFYLQKYKKNFLSRTFFLFLWLTTIHNKQYNTLIT